MITLHPEYLKKNGNKEFVVLPYEEFLELQELLEDIKDLVELRAAREEESKASTVSLDEVKKSLGM